VAGLIEAVGCIDGDGGDDLCKGGRADGQVSRDLQE